MRPARLTARGRLTALYTATVLAAGLALTGLTYVLMRGNLEVGTSLHLTTTGGRPPPVPPAAPGLPDVADQLRAETLSEFLTQAALALAAVTLVSAGLSWLLAGRVLRPIRQISITAQRLSAANLAERVPVTAPVDDLARLAQTINDMLDRIEHGIADRDRILDSQRLFTANTAHELRTPLTTIRTAIDVTLDGEPTRDELLAMATDVRAAVGHSQRTLDGLLALARSQAGPAEHRPVDLAEVVAGVLDRASHEATSRHLTMHTDLAPAPTSGEPVLLERMVSNLADNAMRYNRPGGEVTVATSTTGDTATLRLANTGRRIPPGDVDALFEPFVRGDRGDRNRPRHDGGSGLGLSIVRAIVDAHHGTITTTAHPAGGLEVTIGLPARAASRD